MLKKQEKPKRLTVQATVRAATPEQERRIGEAIDLFLAEWVRRRMGHREDYVQQQRETSRTAVHGTQALQ